MKDVLIWVIEFKADWNPYERGFWWVLEDAGVFETRQEARECYRGILKVDKEDPTGCKYRISKYKRME